MKIRDFSKAFFGAFVVYVVMAACSGSEHAQVPDAMAEPVSGSRLKINYHKAEDGARVPIWGVVYDADRKEDCVFQQASDGKLRCMPVVSYSGVPTFSDPACTVLVAVATADACAPVPKYVRSPEAQGCGLIVRLFAVGAQIQPATVYANYNGPCGPMPASPGSAYYATNGEVPPSSFVAGAVEIGP
jgi:hypothetical protein